MNIDLGTTLNLIRDYDDKQERLIQGLVTARESAVKFQYELRAFIDNCLRDKSPNAKKPEVILAEVLEKLKAVTPHGSLHKVDA